MIDETERLIETINDATDAVNALHAAIDALPDSKTVEINYVQKIVGEAPSAVSSTEVVTTRLISTGGGVSGQDIAQVKNLTDQVGEMTDKLLEAKAAAAEETAEIDRAAEAANLMAAGQAMLARAQNDATLSSRQQIDMMKAATSAIREARTQQDALAAETARAASSSEAAVNRLMTEIKAEAEMITTAMVEAKAEVDAITEAEQRQAETIGFVQSVQEAARESYLEDKVAQAELAAQLDETAAAAARMAVSSRTGYEAALRSARELRLEMVGLMGDIMQASDTTGLWADAMEKASTATMRAEQNMRFANEALLQVETSLLQLDAVEAAGANDTERLAAVMDQLRAVVESTTVTTRASSEDMDLLAARTLALSDVTTKARGGLLGLGATASTAAGGLLGMTTAAEQASRETGVTGANILAMAMAAQRAGDNIGGMTIPLTAAAFGITGLGTALHLVVMGVFEFLAVFIPAMYAAAAGAMVLYQGIAENVVPHMQSLYTVTEALGPMFNRTAGDMEGLGHSLQTAQDMANPLAYELLGSYLRGLHEAIGPTTNGLSAFGQMGLSVSDIVASFGAKIDVDLITEMGKIRSVLSQSVQDLVMFGQILGNLGHAILNLAAAMPGLAEIVLKVIDGFSQLVKWVSSLNPTLIAVVMGFEEAYRWGGILAGMFGMLGRAIALVGTLGIPVIAKIGMNLASMVSHGITGIGDMVVNLVAMGEKIGVVGKKTDTAVGGLVGVLGKAADFMKTPLAAAIMVTVGALTALVVWTLHSKDAWQQWVATSEKAVQSASNLQVLNVIGSQMVQTQQQIAGVNNQLSQMYGRMQLLTPQFMDAGVGAQALAKHEQQLFDQQNNVIQGAQLISKTYGVDFTSALGLADLAGVKLINGITGQGKAAQQARTQIANLVLGYQQMDMAGNSLANSMSAVNIQAALQNTQVQKVNQAWDQFIGMSTSLTGTFSQFNLDLEQMGNVAQTLGGKIQGFSASASTGIQLSVSQIATALKSFHGSSAQVWQSFDQSVQQANSFMDALRTAAAAGVVSQGQFAQAVASVVGQLIPYASKSGAALSEVQALASEAGGPASGSLATLKGWVDKNAVSSSAFTGMIDSLTTKLSNVTAVARNFAGTLQSDVINAIAQAGVDTSNITGLTQKYTTALAENGAGAKTTAQAQGAFNTELGKLGFTHSEITQLDKELTTAYGLNTMSTDDLKTATKELGSEYEGFVNGPSYHLKNGMDVNKQAANHMATEFGMNVTSALSQAGGKAASTTNGPLNALNQMVQAIHKWTGELEKAMSKWPASEHTNVNVSGTGGVNIKSNIPGVGGGNIRLFGVAARGGVIPGYDPGHDSVPTMLSPGEGVLIPQAVRALGGERGIHEINRRSQHFAAGGVVLPNVSGWAYNTLGTATHDITNAFGAVLKAAMQHMQSQGQAALAASVGGKVSGSVVSWIEAAMKADHIPASWLPGLEKLVSLESGGNPHAVDPIPVMGEHATGLWQMLPSTYALFGGAGGYAGLYNPILEGEAALRYIMGRYGSVYNIPGITGGHYGGYDSGGWLWPGLNIAYNGTGQPEKVTAPNGSGPGGPGEAMMAHVSLHIDGKKFLDAIAPAAYQKGSLNNGNANANKFWAPGNG